MNVLKRVRLVGLIGVSISAIYAAPSNASMVLGYQETGPSGPVTGSGTVNTVTPLPSTTFYGDTFTAPTTTITGSSFGFYDDFLFTIPAGGASADSITSTINLGALLGINNLEVRLYNESGNTPPVLGAPAGGSITGWSSPESYAPGLTGTVSVLNTTVGAGTYVLEIRGNVAGTSGGSYSGTLNLAPVPLPAALPLLLSGIAGLGVFARRKKMSLA